MKTNSKSIKNSCLFAIKKNMKCEMKNKYLKNSIIKRKIWPFILENFISNQKGLIAQI